MTSRAEALQKIAEIADQYQLQAGEIIAALNHTALPDQPERSTSILAKIMAYLGGVFVLAGIALFVGMQWDVFSSAVRVLVTLGVGFAIYLFALATMTDKRFSSVTTPMLLVAALLQPTGIIVLLNEYSPGGDPENGLLFMCVLMLLQQFLTFWAKRRTVLLWTSLFFGAAGFGTLGNILDVDYDIIALALGIGLTAISYAIDKTMHRVITPFWYTFEILENSVFEILYFGVAAGFMYLGTVVASRTLLFSSVIALMAFTGYFFHDSLANAFGLILMGLLLVGLSAFAMSLNRKYIQAKQVAGN